MKKSDIAGRVADRIGLSQSAAGNAVDAVFEAVGEALANGEEVRIAGFGTFGTRNRPARTGRNPQTGESLSIPASTAPAFKPGKALKDAVNDGNGREAELVKDHGQAGPGTSGMLNPGAFGAMTAILDVRSR